MLFFFFLSLIGLRGNGKLKNGGIEDDVEEVITLWYLIC